MKVSTRTLYGLRAVLVLASRFGEGSLSVSQIARKESLSMPYLEQILNGMKKKGFVRSVRGPQGGYVLSKKPSEIPLKTLFYALDGGKFPGLDGKTLTGASDEVAIGHALFWKKFQTAFEEGPGELTLKDLLDEARRVKKSKPQAQDYTFHI